jgi:hypothetical protein
MDNRSLFLTVQKVRIKIKTLADSVSAPPWLTEDLFSGGRGCKHTPSGFSHEGMNHLEDEVLKCVLRI